MYEVQPPTREAEIAAALRRIIREVDLHSRKLVEACGLTGPQLATLRAAERLGEPTIRVLAQSVHLSQATVTGILDRLEQHGFLERHRDERDRRATRIRVTPPGRELLSKAPPLLQTRFLGELERLADWEQTMLLAALQRVAALMAAERLDSAAMAPEASENTLHSNELDITGAPTLAH